MTIVDHELDEFLQAADPVGRAKSSPRMPAAREMLLLALDDQAPRGHRAGPRRRASRRRVAVGLIAGVTLSGGVAAAAWTSSHTGLFGAPGQTENDTTEFLNPRGDDFAATVTALGAGIPFPPGDGPQNYIRQVSPPDGMVQASGVRMTLTLDAACAWTGVWLQARAARDAPAASHAASTLANRSLWPNIGTSNDLIASVGRDAEAQSPGGPQQFWDANCTSLPRAWASR